MVVSKDRNSPKLSAETTARLDAMTQEDIERNAMNEPDNPPMTDDELDRGAFGRFARKTREATGLTQSEFADRYHISLGRFRDWEQGKVKPDSVALAYLKLIQASPKSVAKTIAAA